MGKFTVTYEIVTPESAEHGGNQETGFVLPGEWRIDVAAAVADTEGDYSMELRDAVALAWPSEDCGRWFAESEGRENFRTGAWETRAIHPPRNITAASYGRLRRLFGAR